MKLINFTATKVHDYLEFNIQFRDDVNFIAGLNGSGKTTALKLIMALLTPNLEEIKQTLFHTLSLELEYNKAIYKIICKKKSSRIIQYIILKDGVSMLKEDSHNKHDRIIQTLDVDIYRYFSQSKNLFEIDESDELWVRATELESEYTFASFIKKNLPTPMFLPLDRRFLSDEDTIKTKYKKESKTTSYNSLHEAKQIVFDVMSKISQEQSLSEKKLRDSILKNALSLTSRQKEFSAPTKEKIKLFVKKQTTIEKTLKNLDIDSKDFSEHYNDFFKKMDKLSEYIQKEGLDNILKTKEMNEIQNLLFEWIENQGQLKRMEELFSMVDKHQTKVISIYSEINKFKTLVNSFLEETDKEIIIDSAHMLKIQLGNEPKDLSILSSGESQILIILTHLILNKELNKHEIFIVDEPELSLHISWQEKFVEAVQSANPNLQVILATHSPAIIGGRNQMYVPLRAID